MSETEAMSEAGETDPSRATVVWEDDFRFRGLDGEGHQTHIDGHSTRASSPVTLLLESIASCAAIDVVDILRKGRRDVRSLSVTIEGSRMPDPPRHLVDLRLAFQIEGDLERKPVERAVELSLEKYCSVFHSLRQDLEVETEITLS